MCFLLEEQGQGLVAYALILILTTIVVVAALTFLGPQVGNLYSKVAVCVPPTAGC